MARGLPHHDVPVLHVLVVDDDDDQRSSLARLLEEMGCRVDVAVDGAAAVRAANKVEPDMVLMDLSMPVMDGWESIRRVRELSHLLRPRPHVIALSSFTDARSRQLAFEAGCDEYVVKSDDICGPVRSFVLRHENRRLARSPALSLSL